uniref:Uncharacterized protein n=1 Tax=Octactis speculum TaxID=3111310 RepID=A0A7S2MPY7_9STRA|mmetsp:Transcript_8090/g.10165  ORF Transcript_8090/g.10165 Transcript_8090/m.10165 type:complete len:231 (+) Transcript_8090:63-755(+)|eukprot:CAMPEP_0185769054 /NCGR_PEP_ID=MMETSP1174-20130828/53340_1 /TAXON_ID=35687 /ORGANISM="Dictyocha speculum, Strain CCMP1381" /LENGTH=230 /DNA_ID=CAMNT_0028454003 /DNA_START=63 /DNA_END=755 /DNA_ORIENTATION=-
MRRVNTTGSLQSVALIPILEVEQSNKKTGTARDLSGTGRVERSVSFDTVLTREYNRCAVPSPEVSSGVPVGLDWDWYCETNSGIDDHLQACEDRRESRWNEGLSVKLSPKQRRQMLVDAEVPEDEVSLAKSMTLEGKHDRLKTLFWVDPLRCGGMAPMIAGRCVQRKIKCVARALGRSSSSSSLSSLNETFPYPDVNIVEKSPRNNEDHRDEERNDATVEPATSRKRCHS